MPRNRSDKEHLDAADVHPLDHTPPAIVFERHFELRRLTSVTILSLLSVVLLTISFPPFDVGWLAYIALVPWTLAVMGGAYGRRTVLVAWAAGLIYWAVVLYWLLLPTVIGAIAGMIYLSLYWLLAAVVLRKSARRNWPMWLVLPVLWVGIEFLQSRIIGGFPWFFLAQTQYERTRLIQIADVTGQYGVSFFVAMVNGLLVDVFSAPLFVHSGRGTMLTRRIPIGLAACAVSLVGLVGYGTWRLSQETVRPGPMLGLVQEAVPISLQGRAKPQTEVLVDHLRLCTDFIGADCDAVLLPETMLPTGLNREVLTLTPSTLSDDSADSLGEKLLGRGASTVWTPDEVRKYLAIEIGSLPPEAYLRPAMMVTLGEFVEPAEFARLSPQQIRRIGQILLGKEADAADDATLSLAVGALVRGYEPVVEPAIADAAAKLLGESDVPTWRQQRRYGLLKAAAERIACLRGCAALVQSAAILVDAPIIGGVSGVHRNARPTGPQDIWVFHNAAVRFDPSGIAAAEYAKMHLVPFSEYVPFKYSWPGFHRLLRRFVPASMPQLEPGRKPTHFTLDTPQGRFELATPICFEGTFARVCREMTQAGPKDSLVLANLSNDGWFTHRGSFGDWLTAGFRNAEEAGPWRGTTEQSQHLSHYVFRAIETRVPVVRAVNTGISGSIDSNGRVRNVVELTAGDCRQRTMVVGVLAVRPLVDARQSVYSLAGDVFAITVTIAAGALIASFLACGLKHSWTSWRNRRDTPQR